MAVKTVPTEDYARQILGDRDFITSDDIPMSNDFDYVMSIMIAAEYDYINSSYRLELLDGNIIRNGYTVPNIRICKKP